MAKPKLEEKDILNTQEAIRYWNLSRGKFYDFLEKTDGGDFLAYYKVEGLLSAWRLSGIYHKIQR